MLKFAKAGLALRQANYSSIFRNLAAGAATLGVAGVMFVVAQGVEKIAGRSEPVDIDTMQNAVAHANSPEAAGCLRRSVTAFSHAKTSYLTKGELKHISDLCEKTVEILKRRAVPEAEDGQVLACITSYSELALPQPLTADNVVFSRQPAQSWRIVSGCRSGVPGKAHQTQPPLLTPP